jgi:hypothetical protein
MKKKRLENNPEIQKRLKENQSTDKKSFMQILKKAIRPASQRPA